MRLIQGGRAPIRIGEVTVHVALVDEALPVAVDAVVVEEDTWLSLQADNVAVDDDAPVRTHTAALDAEPLEVGAVVERGRVLRAVVVDVDADVPCTAAGVERAVAACLARAAGRALRMPLLGSAHGRLDPLESARAVRRACLAHAGGGCTLVVVGDGEALAALRG